MTEDVSESCVLVVEDESDLADLYTVWLDDEYEVRTAYDGNQALELYDTTIDVVLLDRRLPDLSGTDVLDSIHQHPGNSNVAMVTAVEPEFDILELGWDEYLTKPVSRETLSETVDRLLTRKTYSQDVQAYFTLLSKQATFEAEKDDHELEQSDEYAALQERIDQLENDLDETVAEMDEADLTASFYDFDEGNPSNTVSDQ